MALETVFTMMSSNIKYGFGATREVGSDMKALRASRVLVVTDANLADKEPVSVTLDSLQKEGLETEVFDQVRIEPTDVSFKVAIEFATEGKYDGYVAVGGGSSMDTAKAANLYATYPADFFAYIAAPIGEGRPVPGPLKPMIAIPTTAGTGSETTGTSVLDVLEKHVKTSIVSPAIRPLMGILDPNNIRTQPKMVATSCGLDVLTHALESLTAVPFTKRPAAENPQLRPTYQGANPISHMWASRAIEMVSRSILRATEDPSDDEALSEMILAAAFAGIGFGNAGVHLPHAMSYPVSGMVRDYIPEGYPKDHPIIPHGMCVALHAPASFRFTAQADPDMHLYAARLMGVDTSGARPEDAGELLGGAIVDLMRKLDMPNGLSAVGFGPEDLDELVEGALYLKRFIVLAARLAEAEDLRQLFKDSLKIW